MICLITGSNGLLGQKLVDNLKNYNYTIIATSLGENKNPITGFLYLPIFRYHKKGRGGKFDKTI